MKLLVTIYTDEDGMYIAECPAIPGCVSQGHSEAEAEQNIKDAIRECLAVWVAQGLPLTIAAREIEVSV
jgi:predicted RNase H-like HicB family nuclease